MGYAVVAVNFHGSTGFGQAFCDSIRGDWGGQPYGDCMASVDFALKQYSSVIIFEYDIINIFVNIHVTITNRYLDSNRVGALGASYGGYMINWINGHTVNHYY